MKTGLAAGVARVGGVVRSLSRTALLGLALAGAALVSGAPADIARGVGWLQAQVQPQGTLAIESRLAAQNQARCETAATLLKLSSSSAGLTALVASLQEPVADSATESLACWHQLRQQLGERMLSAELEARKTSASGYAAFDGFSVASAADTGWALAAQIDSLGAPETAQVLNWLQGNQRADGSFGATGVPPLLSTAVILRALKQEASRSSTAAQIASKAAAYLLAQRNSQGNWQEDVTSTALAFEAAHPYTGTDATIASVVETFLLARQQTDGSWAGDPYVTAVALRALALTSTEPQDPTLVGTATVKGTAIAADSGQVLAGVTVQARTSGGTVKSATTNAYGQYFIQGVSPGSVDLSAGLTGYQPVSVSTQLGSGTTAYFSPALYPPGAAPSTSARVTGHVKDFGSDTPLSGVAVSAGAASGATDASGAFGFELSAGDVLLGFSKSGYIDQSRQLVLVGGARVDVGTVVMRRVRETSTLRGTVLDLEGRPIAGASVAVVGGGTTTSSSVGAYQLSGISGLQITVRVSATNHVSRDYTITLSEPTDLVRNFNLPGLTAPYLNLSEPTLTPQAIGLRQDVTATVTISNASVAQAAAVATAQIISGDGSRIAGLVALGSSGHLAGEISLAPAEQRVIHFKWNSGTTPPGQYAVHVRLHVPDSTTRENADGIVLASTHAPLDITGGASFFGSVSANPPVLRAGTSTPVKLSALIQNNGNVPLPAQDYKLAVVDDKTGQTAHAQTISSEQLPKSGLRPLVFADWLPQSAGSYRLELSAPSTPGAMVTSTLYVGDAGAASFSVNKSFVPAGSQTVRGAIKVSGQDVTSGAITDPLAPLVRDAIQTAVRKADAFAYEHYLDARAGQGQCFMCHVQAQSVVGGSVTSALHRRWIH